MNRLLSSSMAILALCAASASLAADVTVIDGDTIVYEGKQAEIWGVIAPSKGETCATSGNEKWPCGERAFTQLSEAAADETFACEEKEPGFLLCRAGGLDVGLLMVKEGLVRARQDYHDVEARAREARVGLWQ
ncbi:MAG: thermonuclease family protein [Mesorhizobium sp.]|nr:thermonuclease family protein [Mesorhizobium sp.]MBL8580097.1 thermonuclease family protein [Mesorhizobium sp.]